MSTKLKRFPNFTESERQLLIKVAVHHKSIIECKKTDAVTWREKLECWDKIADKFNACSTAHFRTAKQLKNKYEAIKKEMRKKHSEHKVYVSGTGGGQFIPPPNPTNEDEKILAETIILSVQGLASQFYNDAVAGPSGIPAKVVLDMSDTNDDEVDVDWNNPSAKLWQTPKHHLIAKIDFPRNVEDMAVESSSATDEVSHFNNAAETLAGNELNKEGETEKKSKAIKKKWQVRRTPVLPRKRNMSSVSGKFEEVAEKRLQLLELQTRAVQNKIVLDEAEHVKTMEILELRKKKELLEIEYMQRQRRMNE